MSTSSHYHTQIFNIKTMLTSWEHGQFFSCLLELHKFTDKKPAFIYMFF